MNANVNVNKLHDLQHHIYTKFTNPVKLVATLSPDERITIHDGRRSRNRTQLDKVHPQRHGPSPSTRCAARSIFPTDLVRIRFLWPLDMIPYLDKSATSPPPSTYTRASLVRNRFLRPWISIQGARERDPVPVRCGCHHIPWGRSAFRWRELSCPLCLRVP